MTTVTSQICWPNGKPAVGMQVRVRILAALAPWLADSTGKVLGSTMSWTNQNGWWRLEVEPYSVFESDDWIYHEFIESTPNSDRQAVTYARVPPAADPAAPVLLRDIAVNLPDPSPHPWIAIDKLSRLRDVDRESVVNAKPGDHLVMLPSGKWGAGRGTLQLGLDWQPDPDNLLAVTITVSGFGGSGARLEFGDGTHRIITEPDPVPHTYAQPGTYTLTATDLAWPAFNATDKVRVKDAETQVRMFVDADDDWRALLWLNEPADTTKYLVDWGDGSPIEEITGQQRVPPIPRRPHQYIAQDTYWIKVIDTATKRIVWREFLVGEIGQVWTFPAYPKRPRVEALWFRTGASWQLVRIEDNLVMYSGVVPPHGRVRGMHPEDLPDGTWTAEFREIVDGQVRRRSRRLVPIPTIWDHRLGVDLDWKNTEGKPGHQDVTIAAHQARAACLVTWGDGSPQQSVPAGQPVTHTYDLTKLPADGWTLQLTELGLDDARTWTRLIARPRLVGDPVMNARGGGAVDLDVLGADGLSNSDWYRIDWGDGTAPDPAAAFGRWFPAHHRYASPGTYPIAVDGPGMLEPERRVIEVINYPAPTVLVREATNDDGTPFDPTRRTARITVDNSASGGPCEVHFGDNSPIRECEERETFDHRYPPPVVPLPPGWEIYWVVATSKADRTAKGQAPVQMPFGTARTLHFTVEKDPDDATGYTAKLTITESDIRKTVEVDWGDGTVAEVPFSPVSHQYLDSGSYPAFVYYTDETERYPETVDIPYS